MPAVEVTISGVLYDKLNRTTQQVVIIGDASLTGLGVGGGPIIPPQQPPSGGGAHPEHPIYYPPGIWGPTDPRPTPPISGIPGLPGFNPPPVDPPENPSEPKPPPAEGGWGWHPEYGWGYFPMSGGKPNPAPGS